MMRLFEGMFLYQSRGTREEECLRELFRAWFCSTVPMAEKDAYGGRQVRHVPGNA